MRTAKQLAKAFDKIKKSIAADRDRLRELMAEMGDIEECSTRATEAMDEAADALSEYL